MLTNFEKMSLRAQ